MSAQRERAAAWYDAEASRQAAQGYGGTAAQFRKNAERIRAGDADDRLEAVERGQKEFDECGGYIR